MSPSARAWRNLRRAHQVFFLLLFFFLLGVAAPRFVRGYPTTWFLTLDPLAAVATALAAHTLVAGLLWALPVIVLTLIFGRVFCSWICPLGTLQHLVGRIFRARPARAEIESNRVRPSQQLKYVLLALVLGVAAAGSSQAGLLDPLALLYRGLAVGIVPGLDNLVWGAYQGTRHFQGAALLVLLLAAVLAASAFRPRFFCRVLCPTGALLGLLARLAVFRVVRRPDGCSACNVCGAACQGAADPQGTVRTSECLVCLNCLPACREGSLAYRALPRPAATAAIDPGRRRWITAAAAGVVAAPLLRVGAAAARPDPRCIRPPGALPEEDFLERCLKCGACMKICPTGGLQPALGEAGVEGLWSPVLVPRLGHCEQLCTLCGPACPTGAIRPLTLADRTGDERRPAVRLGSAAIDRGRCLPWASDRECIVCEEVCPTSPKAIHVRAETVVGRDGERRTLLRPYVDLAHCVGCGVCEARCPLFDEAAIRVSSVGESRSRENQVILL